MIIVEAGTGKERVNEMEIAKEKLKEFTGKIVKARALNCLLPYLPGAVIYDEAICGEMIIPFSLINKFIFLAKSTARFPSP